MAKPPGLSDSAAWYEHNAGTVAPLYESVRSEAVHDWLLDYLPSPPALVLDVGAGTGRDAAWLADRGLDVVAVEPAPAMREHGRALHPSPRIRWIDDSLPGLEKVSRLGLSFDLILLSAVWMHVPESERARAFRKLVTVLKPGGILALSLRHGPADAARGFHPVSQAEIESLSRAHGAFVERATVAGDRLGRGPVSWTQIVVRLPDDGTGALPLLRHIILNDQKASTYKLALLRALCRIADGAAGYAQEIEGDHVAVPLGLVALYWIRLFKPLIESDLPQTAINRQGDGLGFVRDGFRALHEVSHLDLRIGATFGGERSLALHAALRDAARVIRTMPATFTTYASGEPVFPVRSGNVRRPASVRLDHAYLSAFGTLLVPRHLWRALQRFDAWIEPALVTEWRRLMTDYAARQERSLPDARLSRAMAWSDPSRDVDVARRRALHLVATTGLHCAWTGRTLTAETLDIDHCFPWSAWPCDDLWNLLPAHRSVNQTEKRDRLPGVQLLRRAEDRLVGWWDAGYLRAEGTLLPERFMTEAQATLPLLTQAGANLEDVFASVAIQRARLKHDQQIPEWEPAPVGRRESGPL
ncbi:MAG: class I SAM-dependent methyltransferase [Reyranellaceae bacterium]